jgi:hypothetical protein
MRFQVFCRLCAGLVVESDGWFETTAPIADHLAASHTDLDPPSTDAGLFALVSVQCRRDETTALTA